MMSVQVTLASEARGAVPTHWPLSTPVPSGLGPEKRNDIRQIGPLDPLSSLILG